jgi:hypothetical protein
MAGLEPAIHLLGAKRMDARRMSAMAWSRPGTQGLAVSN